jgi:hypothetical protein
MAQMRKPKPERCFQNAFRYGVLGQIGCWIASVDSGAGGHGSGFGVPLPMIEILTLAVTPLGVEAISVAVLLVVEDGDV